MRVKQNNSRHGIQRFYVFPIFTSLLALVILALGCGSQRPTGNNQGEAQPSPTPRQKECRALGETPIVISGGSFLIDFSKDFKMGDAGVFTYPYESLATGFIYNNNPAGSKDNEIPLGDLSYADITVWRYVSPNNYVEVVTIESRKDSNSVTIKFKVPINTFETRKNDYANQYFKRDSNYRIAKVTVKNYTNGANDSWVVSEGIWSEGKAFIHLFGRQVAVR